MEVILEFVRNHYMDLIKLGLLLIGIIILICKKKVNLFDVVKTVILEILPTAILEAEKRYPGSDRGIEKKDFVLNLVEEYLANKYGIPVLTIDKLYNSFIKESIEDILSTPTKKER